jgi:hypothetical protein
MAEIAWWLDSHVHLSMPSVSITTDVWEYKIQSMADVLDTTSKIKFGQLLEAGFKKIWYIL